MNNEIRDQIAKYIRCYYFHSSEDIAKSDETAARIYSEIIQPLIDQAYERGKAMKPNPDGVYENGKADGKREVIEAGWKSPDEFKAYGITCIQEGKRDLIESVDKYFLTEPWMTEQDWQALKG